MKFLIETPSSSVFLPFKYVPFTQKLTPDENALINFLHPDIKIFCDQCLSIFEQGDISIYVDEIETQKEKKSEKDYCLKCFCSYLRENGKQNNPKIIKGKYYMRSPGVNCLTSSRWRVADDLLFLQAIKKFGYGNWNKITYYMQLHGCQIKPSEYQRHFLTYFQKNNSFDSFKLIIDLKMPINESSSQSSQKENIKPMKKNPINQKELSDHFLQWQGIQRNQKEKKQFHIESIMNKLLSSFQQQDFQQILDSNAEEENQQMYIPERDEFLIDHDPFAQSLIANLEFNDDDSEEEIQMKEQLLLAYNEKLIQRKKRKILAVNHNLIKTVADSHKRKQNEFEFFLNKSPQEPITAFLDPFLRLFKDQDEIISTKTLINNHYNAKEITRTISWVKKNANIKLKTLQSLQSIVKSTIENEPQEDNKNETHHNKELKKERKIIIDKQTLFDPSLQQKMAFIQSQIQENESDSAIRKLKFNPELNKSISQSNTVNLRRQ